MTTLTPEDLVNKLRLMSTKLNAGGKSIALQAADLIEQQEKFRQSLTPKPIEEAPRDGTACLVLDMYKPREITLCGEWIGQDGADGYGWTKANFDHRIDKWVIVRRGEIEVLAVNPTHYLPLSALTALMPKG